MYVQACDERFSLVLYTRQSHNFVHYPVWQLEFVYMYGETL